MMKGVKMRPTIFLDRDGTIIDQREASSPSLASEALF